ncbi:universal stress protein [Desulfohalobiaceae bacterium Ax17]|jgi:nucleotide-binding universal stress UspA family protein|uniref:universal stress protein n=1 Tax=Desulfovulcanus ferrireducens TaxID=2831190 RepID=UPI00207BA29E|nr:universal stress protein [Desulfovulcanus ferrireducens]MBT8764074.1 universal stress protein [Desulfovulcanus ferrireducens]
MFKKILLATNGSKASKKAEDYALYLVKTSGAQLTVVHVMDDKLCHYGYVDQLVPGTTKEQFVSYVLSERASAAQQAIYEFNEKAKEQKILYDLKLRRGEPAKEIVAAAAEEKCDLVIVGGRHPSERKLFKSTCTADKVASQSPCSVTVII